MYKRYMYTNKLLAYNFVKLNSFSVLQILCIRAIPTLRVHRLSDVYNDWFYVGMPFCN